MGFSVPLLLQTHTCKKFIVPEVHFRAKSIDTSPVVAACKTAKLFNFFNPVHIGLVKPVRNQFCSKPVSNQLKHTAFTHSHANQLRLSPTNIHTLNICNYNNVHVGGVFNTRVAGPRAGGHNENGI